MRVQVFVMRTLLLRIGETPVSDKRLSPVEFVLTRRDVAMESLICRAWSMRTAMRSSNWLACMHM